MLKRISYIESSVYNPYKNLALEYYLLRHCDETEIILYLWQNDKTVVIGRNQNAWQECCLQSLEAAGGCLARRLSGGGAVYHDLGNLNYSFIAAKGNYDVQKQLNIIYAALDSLGLSVEFSGRNDILCNGRKISGTAFFEYNGFCCQHGTLLLNVDVEKLTACLNVDLVKLESNGVASVQARVMNLQELQPDLTICRLKSALRSAFEQIYDMQMQLICLPEDEPELAEREEFFSSWQWRFGRKIRFQQELSRRFSWGNFCLRLQIKSGRIRNAMVYSDALYTGLISGFARKLYGVCYTNDDICNALRQCAALKEELVMRDELLCWLQGVEI